MRVVRSGNPEIRAAARPLSTDDPLRSQSEAPCMNVAKPAQSEGAAYAAGLQRYARGQLEGHALRAWMIRRLMLDLALDHDAAARATDAVIG